MMMNKILKFLIVLFVPLSLFTCGIVFATAPEKQPTIQDKQLSQKISIEDYKFEPEVLNIKQGTTVTWTNQDAIPHTVTSDKDIFKSGELPPMKSYSYQFNKPGTYHYKCSIHPYMVGMIIVHK